MSLSGDGCMVNACFQWSVHQCYPHPTCPEEETDQRGQLPGITNNLHPACKVDVCIGGPGLARMPTALPGPICWSNRPQRLVKAIIDWLGLHMVCLPDVLLICAQYERECSPFKPFLLCRHFSQLLHCCAYLVVNDQK